VSKEPKFYLFLRAIITLLIMMGGVVLSYLLVDTNVNVTLACVVVYVLVALIISELFFNFIVRKLEKSSEKG